jgi:hypothetical protein
MLVTVDPYIVRAWSLSHRPESNRNAPPAAAEIQSAKVSLQSYDSNIIKNTNHVLNWLNLLSGQFFREHATYFQAQNRADVVLLDNLCFVREKLLKDGLPERTVNSILARLVFIQFLFDRKDKNGTSVFSEEELFNLYSNNILQNKHKNLCSILTDHNDAYAFFQLVNDKFNGDLFPGKTAGTYSKGELSQEKQFVKSTHLQLLSEFVGGTLLLSKGQYSFWPMYSFDVIPLEFISSIYQEFLGDRRLSLKAVYTPPFLADHVLDAVLPWNGASWELRIADFACGSGIFLVKSFQRLVARYKTSTGDLEPSPSTLVSILTNCIFGVDKDEEAVRVASFSLYLALCDEISPSTLKASGFKLPILRDNNLLIGDFFSFPDEALSNSRISKNHEFHKFDIVVGNAPWGENSIDISEPANEWASKNHVPVANGDIGPLFLFRALTLLKLGGQVSMVQPASTLFKNRSAPSSKLRQLLFNKYSVERITNLSLVRFSLFQKSIAPSCIVSVSLDNKARHTFTHIAPKPQNNPLDGFGFDVEALDINEVPIELAKDGNLTIWASLLFGTARDTRLIEKLSKNPTLSDLENAGKIKTRQGIIRGTNQIFKEEILNRRIIDKHSFDSPMQLSYSQSSLRVNEDGYIHYKDSTDFSAFNFPQVILSRTFSSNTLRFKSIKIEQDTNEAAPVCSDSFVTVNGDESILRKTVLAYNSSIATYFLTQVDPGTTYRQKPSKSILLNCPLPSGEINQLDLINLSSQKSIDSLAFSAYGLNEAEQALVEDYCNFALASLQSDSDSVANKNLILGTMGRTTQLDLYKPYIERFSKNLTWLVGEDLKVYSRIRQSENQSTPPYLMIEFLLSPNSLNVEEIEVLNEDNSISNLTQALNANFKDVSKPGKRIARLYRYGDVSSIFIIKPNQRRYWTRSAAMRDADDVVADFIAHPQF